MNKYVYEERGARTMVDNLACLKEAQCRDMKLPASSAIIDSVIEDLKELEQYRALSISFDRLKALCAADKNGLVPICPVKLHQQIFRVFHGEVYEEIVCKAMFEPFTPRPRWKIWTMGGGLPYYWRDVFGKTVFLTRPEAEAALNPAGIS